MSLKSCSNNPFEFAGKFKVLFNFQTAVSSLDETTSPLNSRLPSTPKSPLASPLPSTPKYSSANDPGMNEDLKADPTFAKVSLSSLNGFAVAFAKAFYTDINCFCFRQLGLLKIGLDRRRHQHDHHLDGSEKGNS